MSDDFGEPEFEGEDIDLGGDEFEVDLDKPSFEEFEHYEHHGKQVWVRTVDRGFHRDYCLCYECKKFKDGKPEEDACPISSAVYENCVKFGLVTPVWECPDFDELKE